MNFFNHIQYKEANLSAIELADSAKKNKLTHITDFKFDIDMMEFYGNASELIGTVHDADEDLQTGKLTGQRWIAVSYDPEHPDKYRTANTRQPMHTDSSYEGDINDNLTFFYCTSKASMGGATTFLDLATLTQSLELDGQTELLEKLKTIPVTFRKADQFKTKPILTIDEIGIKINWNYHCADPNNTPEALDLVKDFHEYLENRVVNAGIVTPIILAPGEAVFFHDERILHGRNAFFTKIKGERTLIKGTITLNK